MKRTLDLISFASFTFLVVFIMFYSAINDHQKSNGSVKIPATKDHSAKLLSLQSIGKKAIQESMAAMNKFTLKN